MVLVPTLADSLSIERCPGGLVIRSLAPTVIFSSLLLATAGCAPGFDVVMGEAPEGFVSQKIHGGSAPTEWYHDAVVSLHQRQGNSVYTDPFCTGTLISNQHVLTAGHCLEGSSANKVHSSSRCLSTGLLSMS